MSFVIGRNVARVELPSTTVSSSSVETSCATTIPPVVALLDGVEKQQRMTQSDEEREAGIALATMKQRSYFPVPLQEGEVFLPKNKIFTEEVRAPPLLSRFRKTSCLHSRNSIMKRSERMMSQSLASLEHSMQLSEQTARKWCNNVVGTMSGNDTINKYDTLIPDHFLLRNMRVQGKPVNTIRRNRPSIACSKQFFRLRSKMRLTDISRRMLLNMGREIDLNKLTRSKNHIYQETFDTSIHSLLEEDVQLPDFGPQNYRSSGAAPRCMHARRTVRTTTDSYSLSDFLKKKTKKITTSRKMIVRFTGVPVTP